MIRAPGLGPPKRGGDLMGQVDLSDRATPHNGPISALLLAEPRLPAGPGSRTGTLIRVDDGAQHDPALVGTVVAGAAMHRCLFVPHQHVADPPRMVVDEPVLRRMIGELLDQLPSLVLRYSLKAMRVQRVDEEDRPAGHAMADHRRPRLLGIFAVEVLLGIALVEPDTGRPVLPTVQPDKPGQPLLHRPL